MEQRSQGMSNNGSKNVLGEEAHEQLDELRQRVGEINQRLMGFIKERPGTSLLIAAAAGYLIGRIFRS